jgi:uncharacterized glyoxalase superfamily protein PhnB
MPVRPSLTPCLVYTDAPAAIDFLCQAFGFTEHLRIPGAAPGEIVHAQLVMGDSIMVMLSSATQRSREAFGMVAPGAVGGLVTACLCVALDDPDAHHGRAAAAGADIMAPPHDNEYGGRGYEVRDPEGNVWSFASFDPWA